MEKERDRKRINETPYTSEQQKHCYTVMLTERKEKVPDFSLSKLLQKERKKQQRR